MLGYEKIHIGDTIQVSDKMMHGDYCIETWTTVTVVDMTEAIVYAKYADGVMCALSTDDRNRTWRAWVK